MKRFTKSSQACESATRSRDLGCPLGNMWPEMARLRGTGPREGSAMRKLFSTAEQCLREGAGHNVNQLAIRSRFEREFLPAKVTWELGSMEVAVSAVGQRHVLFNHHPLEIARSIDLAGQDRVSFSPELLWLRVQVDSNAFKFFSLSKVETEPCLEVC